MAAARTVILGLVLVLLLESHYGSTSMVRKNMFEAGHPLLKDLDPQSETHVSLECLWKNEQLSPISCGGPDEHTFEACQNGSAPQKETRNDRTLWRTTLVCDFVFNGTCNCRDTLSGTPSKEVGKGIYASNETESDSLHGPSSQGGGPVDCKLLGRHCYARPDASGLRAALWPFFGIVAEVVLLLAVIYVYEKRRSKNIRKATELDKKDSKINGSLLRSAKDAS